MICNYELSSNILILFSHYRDFDHEVGGAIFAYILDESKVLLRTASMKHGTRYNVNFCETDYKIFYCPEGLSIAGTWHLHPGTYKASPSSIDKYQWMNWDETLIHIIITKLDICLYSSTGKEICRVFFEGN